MRYRRFGKTDRLLSVFSLGTMRCLASEKGMYQTVQNALALGVNHLETAKGYGQSEVYLGKTLQADLPLSRSQVHITTKISPTPDAAAMERAINESLDRLNLDYIDALAIHGVNTWEHLKWVKSAQGCMKAVQQAVADGRVRHIGFSTHGF